MCGLLAIYGTIHSTLCLICEPIQLARFGAQSFDFGVVIGATVPAHNLILIGLTAEHSFGKGTPTRNPHSTVTRPVGYVCNLLRGPKDFSSISADS